MDQVRQAMANIQQQVGKMTASQKLLLASLSVIAVMTLFLVSQYAAKPAMVNLMAIDGQVDTVRSLQMGGFDVQMIDGQVVVPQGQQRLAISYLAETGQLPGDTTLLFGNLIGSQDWKASSAQHRQQFNIAKQNELALTLSSFGSIKKASVILDIPMASGLGRASRSATASVTLFTSSGGAVSQALVDSVAMVVSGAVSGLSSSSVQVIDGTNGRARKVTDEGSRSSGRYLEYATEVEKHTQQKIESMFGHIPGVIVSVTAQVDITAVQTSESFYMPSGEGSVSAIASETTNTNSSKQASRGSEPGVRSNQTASINTGGGSGTSTDIETGETTFQNAFGQRTKNIADPRGMPTKVNASVIFPQEYIQGIIASARPVVEGEEPTPVTKEEAEEFFRLEKVIFENLIQPHLVGIGANGIITQGSLMISMAPIGTSLIQGGVMQGGGGFMSSLTGGGGSGALGSSSKLIETVLVGILAVVSLGMMAMMVKRSSNKIELPSAQDLVGVPPHLESAGDIVGEASEGEHVMTGIEIDDQLIEVQQIREQVAELIKQDPESAAGLVERWAEHVEV